MKLCFYVYMMGSGSRRALYAGVTSTLYKRVFDHKEDLIEGFTRKYKCHRLVYFEAFENIEDAIAREKEIKGWRREKKNALVELMNPEWKDLAADWPPPPKTLKRKVPPAYSRAEENARSPHGPRDDKS